MGFRLFKRIRIFPGITLNVSKSGVSLSAGVRGAHVTVGSKGVRQTVGLPGTGMFYTQYARHGSRPEMGSSSISKSSQPQSRGHNLFIIVLLVIIGVSATSIMGINIMWTFLIIAGVIFFIRRKGMTPTADKDTISDYHDGLDKRFFTPSGDPKYSEADVALIGESGQALILLVNTSLTIANESTDYDTRVKNTDIAKNAIATLQKYVETYPGMQLTKLDEVMHSVELVEQETRDMVK